MGFAQLVARLEREADARVAAIEDAARRELEAIAEEGARASSEVRAGELARLRAARRARLAFIERVLARARVLLEDAEHDGAYLDGIAAQTGEALRYVDDRPITLRCRPALAARLAQAMVGRGEIVLEPDATCPVGVVLEARDRSVVVDDTLAARLERLAAEIGPSLVSEVLA